MSNDAYEQSGLYSHHSSQAAHRYQQQQRQHKHGSAGLTDDAVAKRWKKNSNEFVSTGAAFVEPSQHRKAAFNHTNSSNSNSSSGTSFDEGLHITNAKLHNVPQGIDERLSFSPATTGCISKTTTTAIDVICNSSTMSDNASFDSTLRGSTCSSKPLAVPAIRKSKYPHDETATDLHTDDVVDRSVALSSNIILLNEFDYISEGNPNTTIGNIDASNMNAVQVNNLHNIRMDNTISIPQAGTGLYNSNISAAVSPTLTTTTTTTTANMLPDAATVECGILNYRPAFLQKLATIKVFVLLLSLLVTVQQAVASGYLNSVITTLEKRYEVPSYVTGLISSMYEIGNVATVIFVSYLGSSRHIPVWIAIGCLSMGTGSLLFVGPQLMMERWSVEGPGANSSNASSICTAATVHHQPIDQLPELGFPKLPRLGSSSSSSNCPPDEPAPGQMTPVLLFIAGQLLLGAGGSPLLTLGTTYIDDHVRRQDSSLYIGIIYTMGAFGPVLGFLLGGYLLSFYVDTFFVPEDQIRIDRTHPRWIGMWWAGFLICSAALFALSIPFIMFPKKLTKEREKVRLEEKKSSEEAKGHKRTKSETSTCSRVSRTSLASRRMYGKDVRDIPACLLKLLLNPIYFMTCLAACMELIIVSGFIVFLPKYLETQFSLSNVQASVFTGGVAIPGACVGTFLGGYLLKRFSLRPKGAVQMVMVCNLVGLSLYGLFFVLGCDNVKMAGATSPYFNRSAGHLVSTELPATTSSASLLSVLSSVTLPNFMTSGSDDNIEVFTATPMQLLDGRSSYFTSNILTEGHVAIAAHAGAGGTLSGSFTVNLTSWCNTGCECSHRIAEPVCGNNGLTYFSPCHAGCTAASPSSFTNCTCIGNPAADPSSPGGGPSFAEVVAVPVATAGPCYIPCNTFLPFMVVLFLMCASVATSQMPLLMIVLRSVSEEERALALGLQFVMYRLIAYIPAPIMFGSVIDSTCLMWTSSCRAGRCLMYDIEQFRFRYVGICASIKVIAGAIFLFDWLLIRWQYRLDMEGTLTVGDIVNSLRSVDRGGVDDADDVHPSSSNGSTFNSTTVTAPHLSYHPQYSTSPGSTAFPSSTSSPYNPHRPLHLKHKSGHKRSQSGCPAGSSSWIGGGGGGGTVTHRRSHSSSSPPPGILANLPGHARRPSTGYQVTFRDINASIVVPPGDEHLAQLESLLPEAATPDLPSPATAVTVQAQLDGVEGVSV